MSRDAWKWTQHTLGPWAQRWPRAEGDGPSDTRLCGDEGRPQPRQLSLQPAQQGEGGPAEPDVQEEGPETRADGSHGGCGSTSLLHACLRLPRGPAVLRDRCPRGVGASATDRDSGPWTQHALRTPPPGTRGHRCGAARPTRTSRGAGPLPEPPSCPRDPGVPPHPPLFVSLSSACRWSSRPVVHLCLRRWARAAAGASGDKAAVGSVHKVLSTQSRNTCVQACAKHTRPRRPQTGHADSPRQT